MLTVLAALAGPLAFLGAVAGHAIARIAAREQDRWRGREETMRLLRWGAEMAAHDNARSREIGIAALTALIEAPLIDRDDVALVAAVFRAASLAAIYTETEEAPGE